MRFLLDECLKPQLKDILTLSGHDAIHVSDIGLRGHPDESVMAAAKSASQILLSADTDFGELLVESGADLPSVILFRRGRQSPIDQATVLLANSESVTNALLNGAIVVFADDRVRVRMLPISNG